MQEHVARSGEQTLVIAGVGLIGGSIGAAVRQSGYAQRVIGLGRRPDRLEQARQLGLIDSWILSPGEIPRETSFVVVCTPVDQIVTTVRDIHPHLAPNSVVTDAGSTKTAICRELAQLADTSPCFVGSHPIAGSEKQGCEAARADLYQGRTCVVTPSSGHSEEIIIRVEQFWSALGMRTQRLSPETHDAILARTSHVPHLVASAVAASLPIEALPWTGTGFRDTTRIAGGDPGLWTAIFRENRDEVRHGLAEVTRTLREFDQALEAGDAQAIHQLLAAGQRCRQQLEQMHSQPVGEAPAGLEWQD